MKIDWVDKICLTAFASLCVVLAFLTKDSPQAMAVFAGLAGTGIGGFAGVAIQRKVNGQG